MKSSQGKEGLHHKGDEVSSILPSQEFIAPVQKFRNREKQSQTAYEVGQLINLPPTREDTELPLL